MLDPRAGRRPAFLRAAKDRRDLAVEDLVARPASPSPTEMAAHRVTNLITHHPGRGLRHFVKNDASGVISQGLP